MFAHHCTACDQRRLVFPGQVTGLLNTDDGILVSLTCWCGAEQTLLTGKAAASTTEQTQPAGVVAA